MYSPELNLHLPCPVDFCVPIVFRNSLTAYVPHVYFAMGWAIKERGVKSQPPAVRAEVQDSLWLQDVKAFVHQNTPVAVDVQCRVCPL